MERGPALATWLCAAVLSCAALPVLPAHAGRCPGSTQAEARTTAFDAEALFPRGGSALTPTGQARLARFARQLGQADVEVVVISVPRPQGVSAEAWRSIGQQRAQAVREHLLNLGLAPDRVYTEQRPAPATPPPERLETTSAPLVIEAVGAWPDAVALVPGAAAFTGARCVALA